MSYWTNRQEQLKKAAEKDEEDALTDGYPMNRTVETVETQNLNGENIGVIEVQEEN